MASESSLWYRIGFALERAALGQSTAGKALTGLKERASVKNRGPSPERAGNRGPGRESAGGRRTGPGRAGTHAPKSAAAWPSLDDVVSSTLAIAAGRLLGGPRHRRPAGLLRLLRAGAAGAAAALLVDLVRPLLRGRPELDAFDDATADRVLAGLAQGLVYGAVIEPRVPGPALVKGALFGSAEYATDAAGGLGHLLRAHTPHGRLPGVGRFLQDLQPGERVYLEHLVFGMTLALLYGSGPSGNGIRVEVDEV